MQWLNSWEFWEKYNTAYFPAQKSLWRGGLPARDAGLPEAVHRRSPELGALCPRPGRHRQHVEPDVQELRQGLHRRADLDAGRRRAPLRSSRSSSAPEPTRGEVKGAKLIEGVLVVASLMAAAQAHAEVQLTFRYVQDNVAEVQRESPSSSGAIPASRSRSSGSPSRTPAISSSARRRPAAARMWSTWRSSGSRTWARPGPA